MVMIFPVLQPSQWSGLHSGALANVWLGTPQRPLLLVSFAWHTEFGRLVPLPQSMADASGDDPVGLALANLEYHHTDFEVVETGGDRMLVSGGSPFSAERVLSVNHMRQAHQKLEADEIVVSLARRGRMLVCGRRSGDRVRQVMTELHQSEVAQARAEGALLLDRLVVLHDGVKVGTLQVAGGGEVRVAGWDLLLAA